MFNTNSSSNGFSTYMLKNKDIIAKTLFYPADELPSELSITTPFTFPIKNNSVYLSLDKMGWWNPLGGHLNENETWQKALIREAMEEAGVLVDNIRIVGYIFIEHLSENKNSKYPSKSIIPMTISKPMDYLKEWQKQETRDRGIFTFNEAVDLLKKREDNNQMLEIFQYIIKRLPSYE